MYSITKLIHTISSYANVAKDPLVFRWADYHLALNDQLYKEISISSRVLSALNYTYCVTMADPKPFSGKIITVTGAAHGIGLAIVKYLVSRGATVSMADIAKRALEQAEDNILQHSPAASVTHTALDIRDRKTVQSWIEATKEVYGRVDGCVNNAGK
ncbi:hypothetical protein EIK77_000804 [Talaromyces pinophilus]|nr:hypothetical protein EIK77_000804 [Talaromyces pinophilus]